MLALQHFVTRRRSLTRATQLPQARQHHLSDTLPSGRSPETWQQRRKGLLHLGDAALHQRATCEMTRSANRRPPGSSRAAMARA